MDTPEDIATYSSPRPWTYHQAPSRNLTGGMRDWIEDANGNIVVENIGHLDGPLIVANVNEATACGTDVDAIAEHQQKVRETA